MPFQMHTLGFFCGLHKADPFSMKKTIAIIAFIIFLSIVNDVNAEEKASASSAKIQSIDANSNSDYRVKVLRDYLKTYNSPLAQNAQDFVRFADENSLDWRLVAAISGVESTFGKQIPYNSYNAWGWGIYGSNTFGFKSWEDGISTISKGLRQNYLNKWGAKDIYQVGKIYAASPTWAQRVVFFMTKMGDYGLRNPEHTLSLSI